MRFRRINWSSANSDSSCNSFVCFLSKEVLPETIINFLIIIFLRTTQTFLERCVYGFFVLVVLTIIIIIKQLLKKITNNTTHNIWHSCLNVHLHLAIIQHNITMHAQNTPESILFC